MVVKEEEKYRILVCDDEIDTHIFTELALKELNVHIIKAWNGEQAIELTKSQKPNLVIMDYKLPQMNGYEASRQIKEHNKSIPIILLTGVNIPPEAKEESESVIDIFLVKPFDPSELVEIVKSLKK